MSADIAISNNFYGDFHQDGQARDSNGQNFKNWGHPNEIKEKAALFRSDEKNFFEKINENKSFDFISHYAPIVANSVASVLHSIAAVAPFVMKPELADKFDKVAVNIAKFVVPPITLILNGIKALGGKRIVEGIIRLIPLPLFSAVPLHNVNIPYGLHSGTNILHDLFHEKDGDHIDKSYSENFKRIKKNAIELLKDFFTGKMIPDLKNFFSFSSPNKKTKDFGFILSGLMMTFSSIAGFLFARKERNSPLAKHLGFIRNLGGFIGDVIFMRDDHKERKITGFFCGIASISGILQRQIKNPKIAKIFSHLLLATDNIGFSFWAYISHLRNKKAKEKEGAILA